MTTAETAQSTDVWTKIEDAQTHFVAGIDPDEWQGIYVDTIEVDEFAGTYKIPFQESDSLSTTITVIIDGAEYDIDDYAEAHSDDIRFVKYEKFDAARCELSGTWTIATNVPFRVLVRPYFTDYAVWEFRHVA